MNLVKVIEKLIVDVDQMKERFKEEDPISVFPSEYELRSSIYGIYRRGDTVAYTGNFIPIWLYSLIPHVRKTIMFIKPVEKKEDFANYCGIYPEELSEYIIKGEVVPILANDLGKYKEEVFGNFFKTLEKEDFPLIRAQLYEDLLLSRKYEERGESIDPYRAFEKETKERAKRYRSIIENATDEQKEIYNREVEKGLAPKLEKLPHFIAERTLWQELCGNRDNVRKIEEGLKSPLEAYLNARYWHYVVVPEVYARYGIIWLADGEDYEIKKREIQIALNSSSEIEKINFLYPKSIDDRKRVLEPLTKIIDGYYKEDFVKETMKKGLIESGKYYKNIPHNYSENVRILKEVSNSWNDVIWDFVYKEKGIKEIARYHLIHGAFVVPYAIQLKDFLTGQNPISEDELKGLIDNVIYLLKLPKKKEEMKKYAESYVGELIALIKGNEKIRNMPFSVVNVHNPEQKTVVQ